MEKNKLDKNQNKINKDEKNDNTIVIGKKLFIILATLFSLVVLSLIIISTWFGIYVSSNNSKDLTNIKTRETSDNFLIEDAFDKTSVENSDNISLFYVERSGAFIVTQTLIDVLLQQQIYPDKEIYIAFNDETMPSSEEHPYTDETWPRAIKWEEVIPEDHIVDFRNEEGQDSSTLKSIENNEMDKFINDYLDGDDSRKIDLYIDSLSYKETQKDDFITDFGDSLKYLNSLTFFSDGTAQFAIDSEMGNIYEGFSDEDKVNAETNIESLVSGEKSQSDFSKSEIEIMSQYMYAANPDNLDINVLGITSDIYKAHDNVLSASGTGLEAARKMMSEEAKETMKVAVGLDAYDESIADSQVGKTNVVISGNLVQNDEAAEKDAKMIKSTYEDLESKEYDMSQVNILYKPHPRSNDEDLETMKQKTYDMMETESEDWIQIIPKEIQFEFFVLTGEFDDDEETNTNYQMYLTGTSTVLPAAYDAGIKSDDIEKYYTDESGLNTMHSWYDGTGIIDWEKVEVQ